MESKNDNDVEYEIRDDTPIEDILEHLSNVLKLSGKTISGNDKACF